jgi:hypothetical protein
MPGLVDFMNAYQRSLRTRRLAQDPLLARGGTVDTTGGLTLPVGPGPGQTVKSPLKQNTQGTNPRQGELYNTISLGGNTYHVYYGEGGKRQVVKIRKKPTVAASGGGAVAPAA